MLFYDFGNVWPVTLKVMVESSMAKGVFIMCTNTCRNAVRVSSVTTFMIKKL